MLITQCRSVWAAPNFPLSCAPRDVSTPCHAAAMAGLRHIDGSDSSRRSGATAERRQVWRSMAPGGHGSGQSIYIYYNNNIIYIYIRIDIYLYVYIFVIYWFIYLFIYIYFIYLIYLFNSILFVYLFKYWFLYSLFSFFYSIYVYTCLSLFVHVRSWHGCCYQTIFCLIIFNV